MLALDEASGTSRRLKIYEGNLSLLREKIAQDPESYEAEFGQQLEHFLQKMRLLQLQPQVLLGQMDSLLSLTEFIASTAHRFPDKSPKFGQSLLDTIQSPQFNEMESELRLAICKACVRLTVGQSLDLFNIVQLMFKLLKIPDKQLRKFILISLVSFIRHCTIGAKRKNKFKQHSNGKQKGGAFSTQASSRLQQFLFSMLLQQKTCPVSARVAQMALVEAYRKQYWRDAKTANALANGVFHEVRKIQVSIMRFFLGSSRDEQDGNQEEESSDEEENQGKKDPKTLKEVMQQFQHAKKTRKRQKHLKRAKKILGSEKKSKKEKNARQCNLEAIRSIYDPQKFVDRLFGQLDGKKNEKHAIRLLKIALCARTIGIHQLQTLGFYSYMHRYLQPKQKEVTRLLLYAAQACHEFVPSDIVEQLIRVVAQNFVSDRNTPEAITIGLNTIREIYASCPEAATEEMVRDLTEYRRMHNKNISMAIRSLIVLLRRLRPRLLHRKDRGRPTEEANGLTANNQQEFDGEEIQYFDEEMEEDSGDEIQEEFVKEEIQDEFARNEADGLPRLNLIEHFHKKMRRQTKEERLEHIREGREERPEYGKPKKRGAHVGRTNRQLAKRKNYQMVRHKVRGKNRQRSFRDRQISLRNYLLRQQGKKV